MSTPPYDVWIDHDGQARPLTERGRDVLAEIDLGRFTAAPPGRFRRISDMLTELDITDSALKLTFRRPHWHLSDPLLDSLPIVERPEGGRHRRDGMIRADMIPPGAPMLGIRLPKLSPLVDVGRHACQCAGKHEPVSIAAAYLELDLANDTAPRKFWRR